MKTFMASPATIERKWYVVDATNMTLGRLASEVAKVLRGKNKPIFTPHMDTGDYVIIVNAAKVSFKNTILIMTSNVGAKRIVEPKNLGFSSGSTKQQDYETMKKNVMEEVKKLFKPEFINRVDEIMVFHQLDKNNMKDIVTLLSENLIRRSRKQMDITLKITPALKAHLVDKYTDLKMGARPLRRAIQTVVEDALAEEILSDRVKSGDTVSAGWKEEKVTFTVK